MKTSRALAALVAAGAATWSSGAAAIDPIPQTPGWRGFAIVGVGHTEIESNLLAGNNVVEIGRPTIASVRSEPGTDSATHPIFTGELNYTTAGRWQFFLGTSIEDALTLDGAVQVGARREVGSAGVLQGGLLFNGIRTKVWEDPYAEGVVRQETNRDSSGARVQWDRVMGTPFQLTFSYRDIDIDDERSGQGVRSVACNAACRELLRRDGKIYTFDASYLWRLGTNNLLRPMIRYRVDDRDGAAVASDSVTLQLSHLFLGQGWTLASNVIFGQSRQDAANPIFGRKTDSDRIALDTTLLYRLPFGGGRWQAVGSATWGEDDSDVNFHDSQLFNVSAGLLYRFGN